MMHAANLGKADVDLTSCDREPIHTPGAIQPHGAMLVLDCNTLKVLQAAGDTLGLVGTSVSTLLGRGAESVLAPEQIALLRELSAAAELNKPRYLLDPALRSVAGVPVDASVHRSDGCLIAEFEAADRTDRHASDPLACVQEMLEGLDAEPSLQAVCQTAAERVRKVTGYDRVMIYRFLEDGSGWVFAESRDDWLTPYLDLHYPASDIPKQARELYRKTWLRLIARVDYEPAPLIPQENPRTGRPLDMSQATLRNVSPIHRQYLRNMGVTASMSISVIRQGELWGLVACHHHAPRQLPRHLRAICELFGSIFSLQLEARERAEELEARLESRKALQELMRDLAAENDFAAALVKQAPRLLNYIRAGGLALRVGQERGGLAIRVNSGITALGTTPREDQIAALTDWLTTLMEGGDGWFATDRLGELWEPAKNFAGVGSGVLAVSVSREPRDFVLWFRPEVVKTVSWAGNPSKPVGAGPNGDRLTPRESFEIWKQTVRGRSTQWLPADSEAAFDLRASLQEVVLRRIDAAARERATHYEQQTLLMAELDHRVKNALACIQALVSQTARSANSLTEFTQSLDHRIHAMAKAHSLLSKSRWEGVLVRSLLLEELDHLAVGAARTLNGPDVTLSPKATLALSLAVHELATNAAKYGALTTDGGRVMVSWMLTEDNGLSLSWTETGGPVVRPPERRGFGSKLVEQVLPMETGGRSRIHFDPDGVRCEVQLPESSITTAAAAPADPEVRRDRPQAPGRAVQRIPRPHRILLVEDSALVLMSMTQVFEERGWQIVGPATRIADAVALARAERLDAALLDIDLHGEMSWEVALVLKGRGVPFAFSTGYDAPTILPAEFAGATVISKPFTADEAERRLCEMVTTSFG